MHYRDNRVRWWLSIPNVITSEHWIQGFPSQGIKGFPSSTQNRRRVPTHRGYRCVSRNWIVLQGKKKKRRTDFGGRHHARDDWDCGRITRWNLVCIIPWQLSERRGEESGVGITGRLFDLVLGRKERLFLPQNPLWDFALGEWVSALEFLIYNLNECSIPFKRQWVSDEGAHFMPPIY